MKNLLIVPLVVMCGCAAQNEAKRSDGPPEGATADAPAGSAQAAVTPAAPKKTTLYPETRVEDLVDTVHGKKVRDPYRWLENEKSPEVQAWMKAQDAFARQRLHALPEREALAKRFHELFYVDSVNVPVLRLVPGKKGQAPTRRFFYTRTLATKEKAILYVKDGDDGQERVLLEPNTWSADNTISLGGWYPSWDGRKVAFKKKPNAADEATIHVIDVESMQVSDVDVIPGGKYAEPSWSPDSKGFYYEWLPTDPGIPVDARPGYTEIRYHALGTDPETDVPIHPRTGDPKTFLAQSLSRDGRYLFVYVLRGWSENDVYVKRLKPGVVPPAAESGKNFTLIARGQDVRYLVGEWKDQLYIATDEGAPKQRIFKVSAAKPERKNWKEIVPEDSEASLQSFNIVGNALVLQYLHNASSELRVHGLDGRLLRKLELPAIGSATNAYGLEDVDDAYFQFSSFTVPKQVYRTSIRSGKTELWAKVELPIDPSPYVVEQVWYPSKDGTKISMFLVHRRDAKRDGQNPVLLYGYGGFDISLTPSFMSSLYPWLEAGGIYAMPNLRGGGEYGKAWHDAGRLDKKQNVFDDFIAAADYLAKEGWSRPSKIAIWGGSNGGLLVGAAMVQAPEKFGAVVCAVPLLDMVRYHLFGSGRTWIPEYGSAEDPKQFEYLLAYSPYHGIKQGTKYPALLMESADHDDRVDPMHARKFVAAIQAASAGDAPALIRIERNAGHGGADQVRQTIDLYADQFAFLMHQFGMTPAAPRAASQGSAH
ncbi:MAG: S9 family peptidase [Myxococcaceae bacterium]|nr:S9 family peptidase [Myxococcaceae bacterium]